MTSIKHAERQQWRLFVLLVAIVVAIGMPFYLDHERGNKQAQQAKVEATLVQQNKDNLACIATWANQYSARSAVIASFNRQKELAFTAYARTRDGDKATARQALHQYDLAQAALSKQLVLHPPPVFKCDGPKPKLDDSEPTTPEPTDTVTRTKVLPGATSTAVVTQPGRPSTVTKIVPVRIPGRTTTKSPSVRTITKDVSPPSCLTSPVPPCVLTIPLGG